jgi:SAM-dependent methyltransferase
MQPEPHPCDLCGSQDAAKLPQAETFGSGGVYVCMGCGFVHVKERRSSEEIAKSWDDIYGDGYTAMWPAVFARLNYVTEWYSQAYGWEGKSVLEIGAGEGRFLEMVRERGAHPVGIDPSARNCQILRSKDIFAHHGTAEHCGTVGQFDVVAILWTLENCQDCIRMLQIARDNLAVGGHVLVATGSRILVPFKKPLHTYFGKNPPDTHCFRWSASSLASAMRKAGYTPERVNDHMQCDWMIMAGVRLPMPTGGLLYPRDDWRDVLDYFAEWERIFP